MYIHLSIVLFLTVASTAFSFSNRLNANRIRFQTVTNAKAPKSESSSSSSSPQAASEEPKRAINLSNLLQLVLMGAGAPGLGEFDRMDENGKMFFKLEANNFVDSKV